MHYVDTVKYPIIHSPHGFSGIIYNTGWRTFARLLLFIVLVIIWNFKKGCSKRTFHEDTCINILDPLFACSQGCDPVGGISGCGQKGQYDCTRGP